MTFKAIKLVSGETIFGRIAFENSDRLEIEDPMSPLHAYESEDIALSSRFVLTAYLEFAAEQRIEVQRKHVVTVVDLMPEMSEYCRLSVEEDRRNRDKIVSRIKAGSEFFRRAVEEGVNEEDEVINPSVIAGTKAIN